jgi:hypothetical protein
MRNRWALLPVLAFAVAIVACGHPEQLVVDKYFSAVNQKDNQTLSSFAVVSFDKKVDKWKITQSLPLAETEALLPTLIKDQKQIDAEINDNKKLYNNYYVENMKAVDEVRDLNKKGSPIPPRLQGTAAAWDKYVQIEKELKKKLGAAKAAVDKEKKIVSMSVTGEIREVEDLPGKAMTRQLELRLTVEGQPGGYLMTLRRYELQAASGSKLMSRWVVTELAPKS